VYNQDSPSLQSPPQQVYTHPTLTLSPPLPYYFPPCLCPPCAQLPGLALVLYPLTSSPTLTQPQDLSILPGLWLLLLFVSAISPEPVELYDLRRPLQFLLPAVLSSLVVPPPRRAAQASCCCTLSAPRAIYLPECAL
jgi:hypothetical protein